MAEKIEVEIVTDDGDTFKFKSKDQLLKWTEEELENWRGFNSDDLPHIVVPVSELVTGLV